MTALARPGEDAHFVDAKPSFIVTPEQGRRPHRGRRGARGGLAPAAPRRRPQPAHRGGGAGTRRRLGRHLAARGPDAPRPLDGRRASLTAIRTSSSIRVNAKTVARHDRRRASARSTQPSAAHAYEPSARRFAGRIDAKLPRLADDSRALRGAKVVTYHKDFDYFAQRFGLEVVGHLEPKPGIPPSPTHLAELVPKMKAQGVRLILVEPYRERDTPTSSPRRPARASSRCRSCRAWGGA